jgi:hypothetical protein
MPEPMGPRSRGQARVRLLPWLWAPLLASLAIALQVGLDVPRAPMLERVEKPKKQPRKSAAARNAGKSKAKPPRQRTTRELAQLRERWSERPLEEEPVDQSFRRRHEGLLRSVVTRARAVALDDAMPPPMQIRPACHTIRCALELCGPSPLLASIAELLPGVTLLDQPLWHQLREVEPVHKPSGGPSGETVCRRWIVDFTRDGGDFKELVIPGPELKAQRPAKHEAAAG